MLRKEFRIAFSDTYGVAVFAYLRQKMRYLTCFYLYTETESVGIIKAALFYCAPSKSRGKIYDFAAIPYKAYYRRFGGIRPKSSALCFIHMLSPLTDIILSKDGNFYG